MTTTTNDSSASTSTTDTKSTFYDDPSRPITLIALPPSTLSQHITSTRLVLQSHYSLIETSLRSQLKGIINYEKRLEKSIEAIKPNEESLNPGLLYVSVSTLAGSILARNRGFLLRPLLPLSLFILSSHHFLPHTTSNLRSTLSAWEDDHFPLFAQQHDQVNTTIATTWHAAKEGTQGMTRTVQQLMDKYYQRK